MSQPENDLISFDDLFAALGPSSPTPKSTGSSKRRGASEKGSETKEGDLSGLFGSSKSRDIDEDPIDSLTQLFNGPSVEDEEPLEEIDLVSALGFSKPSSRRSIHRMSEEERKERDTEREAQIREQQIRAQQWKRELAQQEERKRLKAIRDAEDHKGWQPAVQDEEVAEDITAPIDDQAVSSPSNNEAAEGRSALEASSEQRRSPFAQENKEIAQPAFLDKIAEPKEGVTPEAVETTPASEGTLRGRYSDLPMYKTAQGQASSERAIAAQPSMQAAQVSFAQAESGQAAQQAQQSAQISSDQAAAVQSAQPAPIQQVAQNAQPQAMQAQGQSAQSQSAPSSIPGTQEQEQAVQKQPQSQSVAAGSTDKQSKEAAESAATVSESQPTQRIVPLSVSRRAGENASASKTEKSDEAQKTVQGPDSSAAGAESKKQSADTATDEAPHAAVPPKPSLIKPLGASQGTSQPTDSPKAASMPLVQEAPIAPAPIQNAKEITIEQHTGSSKGNIVGIILIIIAIICAVLTVLLFTGVINYSTFSGGFQQASTSQASASSSATSSTRASSTSSATATEAVYKYVVRGTDGGTYEATETAQFGATGLLEQSSIDIEVSDPEIAKSLMEQLTDEFGSSVQNATTNDNGVSIVVKVDRDDLDLNSYTELLSNSMAEFEVVDTGK